MHGVVYGHSVSYPTRGKRALGFRFFIIYVLRDVLYVPTVLFEARG